MHGFDQRLEMMLKDAGDVESTVQPWSWERDRMGPMS